MKHETVFKSSNYMQNSSIGDPRYCTYNTFQLISAFEMMRGEQMAGCQYVVWRVHLHFPWTFFPFLLLGFFDSLMSQRRLHLSSAPVWLGEWLWVHWVRSDFKKTFSKSILCIYYIHFPDNQTLVSKINLALLCHYCRGFSVCSGGMFLWFRLKCSYIPQS